MNTEIIATVFDSGWFIRSAARAADKNEPNCDNAKRCEAALGIWQSATSARGNEEHKDVASENEGEAVAVGDQDCRGVAMPRAVWLGGLDEPLDLPIGEIFTAAPANCYIY